jgi:thiol-disulfide isomerase/thioredoxin
VQHSGKALLVVLILAGVLWASWKRYENFLSKGQQASVSTKKLNEMEEQGVPDFEIESINGEMIKLSSFKDKVVIVNFWASWCEPCVQEFPSLIKLIERFKGEVVILAISADYTMEELKNFLKVFKVDDPNFLVAWDKDKTIATQFGTQVLPESYVIGYDNKLVRKITGVDDWATPEAFRFFEVLVSGQGPEKASEVKDQE